MQNLNNKEVLEKINKFTIAEYIKSLNDIKTVNLKLFQVFPYTGAANVSEPVNLTMFTNLEKLMNVKYSLCHN